MINVCNCQSKSRMFTLVFYLYLVSIDCNQIRKCLVSFGWWLIPKRSFIAEANTFNMRLAVLTSRRAPRVLSQGALHGFIFQLVSLTVLPPVAKWHEALDTCRWLVAWALTCGLPWMHHIHGAPAPAPTPSSSPSPSPASVSVSVSLSAAGDHLIWRSFYGKFVWSSLIACRLLEKYYFLCAYIHVHMK